MHKFPTVYPSWIYPWSFTIGILNIVSAVALWRLSWLGPILFLVLWVCPIGVSIVVSNNFLILQTAGFAGRVLLLAIYACVIYFYRARLAPNYSVKWTAATGPR